MTNKIRCDECKYSVFVNVSGKTLLCNNPELKTFGKNMKHGASFVCGYGVSWNKEDKR